VSSPVAIDEGEALPGEGGGGGRRGDRLRPPPLIHLSAAAPLRRPISCGYKLDPI